MLLIETLTADMYDGCVSGANSQFGAVSGIVPHYDNHKLQKENSSVYEDQKAI